MGSTLCCIFAAGPEEQIREPRAIDLLSYATRMATSFQPAFLHHGGMVFRTRPKMAKTARFGRNGAHSASHISLAMAGKSLSKCAIETWNAGPNTCPIRALEFASSFFPLSGMAHKKRQAATYPILGQLRISHPKARIHGAIAYSRRVPVPLPNRPKPWIPRAHNPGAGMRARRSWGRLWSKRGLVVQKLITPKIVSLVPKANGLWAFAWKQPKA